MLIRLPRLSSRSGPAPRVAGRPLVLGHRGASAEAPENTMAAFALGMEQGADGMELDVWRCGSGEVVVFHDTDTARLSERALPITGSSLRELQALDVGAKKAARFRGERIPELVEVLEAFPRAVVNIEMKSDRLGDPRLAFAVARIVAEARAVDRVIVSSFDPGLLAIFRARAPDIAAGLLFDSTQSWALRLALAAPLVGTSALHPGRELVDEESMRGWRQRGYAVNVWTVDGSDEIERLCALQVSAIISNVPGAAREIVRRVTGR